MKSNFLKQFNILVEETIGADEKWYHISPFKFDKFSLDFAGRGMGTGFFGKGIYFAKSKDTIDYYCDEMRDSYKHLYVYEVTVSGAGKNENDIIEVDGKQMTCIEAYYKLVEKDGKTEDEASSIMKNDLGVDGMTYWSHEDGDSLVVFNCDAIQIVNSYEV